MRETIKEHRKLCKTWFNRQPVRGDFYEWACSACAASFRLTMREAAVFDYSPLALVDAAYREIEGWGPSPIESVYREFKFMTALRSALKAPFTGTTSTSNSSTSGNVFPPQPEVEEYPCPNDDLQFWSEFFPDLIAKTEGSNVLPPKVEEAIKEEEKKCTCPWDKLYANGCKCGGK